MAGRWCQIILWVILGFSCSDNQKQFKADGVYMLSLDGQSIKINTNQWKPQRLMFSIDSIGAQITYIDHGALNLCVINARLSQHGDNLYLLRKDVDSSNRTSFNCSKLASIDSIAKLEILGNDLVLTKLNQAFMDLGIELKSNTLFEHVYPH